MGLIRGAIDEKTVVLSALKTVHFQSASMSTRLRVVNERVSEHIIFRCYSHDECGQTPPAALLW